MRALGASSLANGGQALDATDPWPGSVRLWPEASVRKLGPNDSFSRDGVFATTKTVKGTFRSYINNVLYYNVLLYSEYITNEEIIIPISAPTKKEDTYLPFHVHSKNKAGAIVNTSLKFVLGTERSFSDLKFSSEMLETEEVSPQFLKWGSELYDVSLLRRTDTKFSGYSLNPDTKNIYYGLEAMFETKPIDIPNRIDLPLYFGVKLLGSPDRISTIEVYDRYWSGVNLAHNAYRASPSRYYYKNRWILDTSKLLRR